MNPIGDFISGVLTIAIVSLLVRPNSQGPNILVQFGNAFANIITAAEGGSSSSSGTTASSSSTGGLVPIVNRSGTVTT